MRIRVGRSSDSQVGGLRRVPTGRRFPVPVWGPVLMTAVVPDYRCGAVPDDELGPAE
jgi:hypothetical protein